MTRVIGVRFRNVGKIYYFSPKNLEIKSGDHVIVETARGVEYGNVVLPPRDVEDEKVVQPLTSGRCRTERSECSQPQNGNDEVAQQRDERRDDKQCRIEQGCLL